MRSKAISCGLIMVLASQRDCGGTKRDFDTLKCDIVVLRISDPFGHKRYVRERPHASVLNILEMLDAWCPQAPRRRSVLGGKGVGYGANSHEENK